MRAFVSVALWVRMCGFVVAALVPVVASVSSAAAIECPEAKPVNIGAIDANAEKALKSELPGIAENEGELNKFVERVRSLAPDANRVDVTNYLIGLYCPYVAAQKELDESAKTQKVSTFATRVTAILY